MRKISSLFSNSKSFSQGGSRKGAFYINYTMEDSTNINPRLQNAIDYWKLKNPYESLIVYWSKQRNTVYAIPGALPKQIEGSMEDVQEEGIPTPLFLSFMNVFLGGRLTSGVDGETFSPFLYFDHRRVTDIRVFIPQDMYMIYLEDEVLTGSFGEEHSCILRNFFEIT